MSISAKLAIFCLCVPLICFANNTDTTANYFASLKNKPNELMMFVQQMPKGGDLHNHLWGASYPEAMVNYAKNDELCLNPKTFVVTNGYACKNELPFSKIINHSGIYEGLIKNWSMFSFHPSKNQTASDHFFNVFYNNKETPIVEKHRGDMIVELKQRAAMQHENYLEEMITTDNNVESAIGKRTGWNSNFSQLRKNLLNAGLKNVVRNVSDQISKEQKYVKKKLQCNSNNPLPACKVKVRFQYLAIRILPPEQVFTQLLSGFLLAKNDANVVGINLVGPEDNPIALRDYKLQMKMIAYLKSVYPSVKVSLHAGELNPNSVLPKNLNFHITQAVEVAHADRIGHGVDIPYEKNAEQLLTIMAKKHIDVEVNLTSNQTLLGIKPSQEPIMLYLRKGVPVTLSTDDEGILRTDISREYDKAVTQFPLSYQQLKNIDRNSLTYSFLPGKNLWVNPIKATPVTACQNDKLGKNNPSQSCQNFLSHSEKARMQWRLEHQFSHFEKQIALQYSTK